MNKKVLLVVLAVLLIGGATAGTIFLLKNNSEDKNSTSQTIETNKKDTKIEHTGKNGRTALQTLKDFVGKENVKNTGSGGMTSGNQEPVVIQSINNITVDETKEYWSFSINGFLIEEDPGTYMTKDGDVIVWEIKNKS
ncbi:MAG: DUF4430 domain-containing protein [Candidatus Saccharimonadales bacterium]